MHRYIIDVHVHINRPASIYNHYVKLWNLNNRYIGTSHVKWLLSFSAAGIVLYIEVSCSVYMYILIRGSTLVSLLGT